MTKDFALAGLRLGYALGSLELVERLARFQPAWSVNSLAQVAGLAAIREIAYYEKTLRALSELKEKFFCQIRSAGFALAPSTVHFGIIHVQRPAKEIRLQLLQQSIQVRDCSSFGLSEYIRVSTRDTGDNLRLLGSLKACFPV